MPRGGGGVRGGQGVIIHILKMKYFYGSIYLLFDFFEHKTIYFQIVDECSDDFDHWTFSQFKNKIGLWLNIFIFIFILNRKAIFKLWII